LQQLISSFQLLDHAVALRGACRLQTTLRLLSSRALCSACSRAKSAILGPIASWFLARTLVMLLTRINAPFHTARGASSAATMEPDQGVTPTQLTPHAPHPPPAESHVSAVVRALQSLFQPPTIDGSVSRSELAPLLPLLFSMTLSGGCDSGRGTSRAGEHCALLAQAVLFAAQRDAAFAAFSHLPQDDLRPTLTLNAATLTSSAAPSRSTQIPPDPSRSTLATAALGTILREPLARHHLSRHLLHLASSADLPTAAAPGGVPTAPLPPALLDGLSAWLRASLPW
jgi:hypothetical protein